MFLIVDIIYLLLLPFLALFACISRLRGHPARRGLLERLGCGNTLKTSNKRVLIHAVSVGEVNAIRTLVQDLHMQEYDVVVCVTTDTGLARGKDLFSDTCVVTRFPLDFSFSMRHFLRRVKPTIIALVELEVWPNMISICQKTSIPVVVINGRLSERSFNRYKFVRPLLKQTFRKLTAIGMQNKIYAERVTQLGGVNVSVQGTMKWDNAVITDAIDGAYELSKDLQIDPMLPLVVIGSSTPEEHELLKEIMPDGIQLLCAPRRPEWFDQAEKTFSPCNRRTQKERCITNYFILDTFGELEKAYALADIVIIGRSFTPLHGSDPTSSIALGKPTVIGPHVHDFEEMVSLLQEQGGIIQCEANELKNNILMLLEDAEKREQLIHAGRKVIASQQGATSRYEQLIMDNTPDA